MGFAPSDRTRHFHFIQIHITKNLPDETINVDHPRPAGTVATWLRSIRGLAAFGLAEPSHHAGRRQLAGDGGGSGFPRSGAVGQGLVRFQTSEGRRQRSSIFFRGQTAFLSEGPPTGTLVVIRGPAELYGAETGVGK